MSSNRRQKVVRDQTGLVSIMVTMIMIMVISLIVLGFAQVTRHNQRQSLDSQLSSQAYYAAESGVNNATRLLRAPELAGEVFNNTGCRDLLGYNPAHDFHLSGGHDYNLYPDLTLDAPPATDPSRARDVGYTCVLINNTPPNLQYSRITNGQARAFPLNTTAPLTDLNLKWDAANNTGLNVNNCSNNNELPANTTGGWNCSYGLLRLDLMQDDGSTTDATTAVNKTLTFFFKPTSGGTVGKEVPISDFSIANNMRAYLVQTGCAGNTCSAKINLSGAASGVNYYARISAVYQDLANVTITAQDPTVNFVGAQAIIDSTGKAQDVLRRIQVHVPLSTNTSQAGAGLQASGSICKLITVIGTAPSQISQTDCSP